MFLHTCTGNTRTRRSHGGTSSNSSRQEEEEDPEAEGRKKNAVKRRQEASKHRFLFLLREEKPEKGTRGSVIKGIVERRVDRQGAHECLLGWNNNEAEMVPPDVVEKIHNWTLDEGKVKLTQDNFTPTTKPGRISMFVLWAALSCLMGKKVESEQDFDVEDLMQIAYLEPEKIVVGKVHAGDTESDDAVHQAGLFRDKMPLMSKKESE